MLTNVTSFFHDPEAFVTLKNEVLPQLCAGKSAAAGTRPASNSVFRAWVPGCASGEEAYSIAILLREFIDDGRHDFKVQIYATDLDDDAIAVARAGCYPPNIARDLTPERLHRFFVRNDTGYQVKQELREMVVFANHNVIKDPPFTKLDLLCCRNLMFDLGPELQERLLPVFHYALRLGGVLFLAPAESIGNHSDLFATISRKWKIYRARHRPSNYAEPAQRALLLPGLQDAVPPVPKKSALAGRRKRATSVAETRQIEELSSANEELQSTNEELQSTNEELETSREELQSVNEELVTVNAELQAKMEQLADMQNDMKNLLDNINVGTVFLDHHLHIRRFTRDATRIYPLLTIDVGRPLADIKSELEWQGGDMGSVARGVLDSLVPWERELRTRTGMWFLVHIQPYRTLSNVVDGVVLTFTDISKRVAAELAERKERQLAEGIVDTVREPLIVLDENMHVIAASRSFYHHFQTAPDQTLGRSLYELGNRQWNIPALRELLETILPRDQSFDDFSVEHDFPAIGRQKMLLNARRIVGQAGEVPRILLAVEAVKDG